MIEVVVGAGLTTIVMFSLVTAMLSGMGSWAKGQAHINSEGTTQIAVGRIAQELREAMWASVSNDGRTLQYRLPAKANGSYVVPATWDNVSRTIRYNADRKTIDITAGNQTSTLLDNVITTDPKSTNGSATYRMFTAGSGSVVRSITVMLAADSYGKGSEKVANRVRETIYLRNVPTSNQ